METATTQSPPDQAAIDPHPEPPSLKLHICRVCGKGFASGCALGGHMHVHATQKDDFHLEEEDEDDDAFTLTDSADGSEPYSSDPGTGLPKLTYSLRTKGGTYRNNHAMFHSWNPILTTDHDVTNQSSSDIINDDACCKSKPFCTDDQTHYKPGHTLTEDEEVAQSLMMLSRGEGLSYLKPWVLPPIRKMEPSSGSLCSVEVAIAKQARLQMPLMVPPIRYWSREQMTATPVKDAKPVSGYRKLFECKSCNKVFTSHQALGGHRASHRKVKGCSSAIAAEESNIDLLYRTGANVADETDNSKAIVLSELTDEPAAKKKIKIHECTICHRLFPTGQALGGHKRCHWLVQNSNQPADQQLVAHNSHLATVAPVFSGSNGPLNLFLDKPKELLTCQPTSSVHFSVPDLGLVTACPRNNAVIDDEADSNNIMNVDRKRKPSDDRLANLGPDDWLRVGIGSRLPA